MNTKSFSEVANKVMARIERVARYEGVVTEILSRVLGDEDIPTPCIEVDTDENVNLVYELKSDNDTYGRVPQHGEQGRQQTQNILR